MLKLIVIGIGGLIAFEGFKAYGALGYEWNGMLGKVLAILIFCVIQQGELRPVLMSRGQTSPLSMLSKSFGGQPINLQLVDPEELHDASMWAFWCYVADMIVGLFVWVPVPFSLIQAGAVTMGDLSLPNIGMIIAVTFVLQECVAYYLRNGGRAPSMPFTKGAKSNAN